MLTSGRAETPVFGGRDASRLAITVFTLKSHFAFKSPGSCASSLERRYRPFRTLLPF
jgi:hypothetical protein